MAWIELHQTLPSSRKTLKLKARLNISTNAQTIGHLCLLWLWALDNAPDGDLSGIPPVELAKLAGFNHRRAGEFLDALVEAGFLDREGESLRIHHWEDYAGRLVESRKKAGERKRRYRERQRAGDGDGDVDSPDGDGDAAPLPYLNRTLPYPTVPKELSGGGDSRAGGLSEPMREYLLGRGLLPEEYLGAGRELLDSCAVIAQELFRSFCAREPTELDRAKVFCGLIRQERRADGGLDCRLDEGRRELLYYAFEQAAAAGKGGCWAYIEGVLLRLHQRGIEDLAQAESFELDRG